MGEAYVWVWISGAGAGRMRAKPGKSDPHDLGDKQGSTVPQELARGVHIGQSTSGRPVSRWRRRDGLDFFGRQVERVLLHHKPQEGPRVSAPLAGALRRTCRWTSGTQTDSTGQTPHRLNRQEGSCSGAAQGNLSAHRHCGGGDTPASATRPGGRRARHRGHGRQRPGQRRLAWPEPWRGTKPMEGEGAHGPATVLARHGPDSGATP